MSVVSLPGRARGVFICVPRTRGRLKAKAYMPKHIHHFHPDFQVSVLNLIETHFIAKMSVFAIESLKRLTRCHMVSENFDAELLLNIRVSI